MLDAVRVNSLGFRTDLMLRLLEGGKAVDHGDYLTLRGSAKSFLMVTGRSWHAGDGRGAARAWPLR
jgi:hypothetical protein